MSDVGDASPEISGLSEPGAFDWAGVAAQTPSIRASDYARRYYELAATMMMAGRTNETTLASLLGHCCSFVLRLDGAPPFAAWLVTQSERSASPDDLTVDETARLRALWPQATDPALRARLADLSWEFGRGPRDVIGARAAVEAYLQMVDTVASDSPDWSYCERHLERALQLAASLGHKNNPSRDLARAALETRIMNRAPGEDGFVTRNLIGMALRFGARGESYGNLAADIAQRAEASNDWHRAREYWQLAAACANPTQDNPERKARTRAIAEAYVREATAVATRPHVGRLIAVGLLQRAIAVLRQNGGERERVAELHQLLLEYQKGSTDAFISHSMPIDIGAIVDEAEAAVSGKSLSHALLALAAIVPLLSPERLRRSAEDRAQRYIGLSLMPPIYHDDEGRVVAKPGSVGSGDPKQRENALRAMMIQDATTHFRLVGEAIIDPARRQLVLEHVVREGDLLDLATHNPVVPIGREGLWAEGLYAGFVGDLPKAIHLLIPQIEHAVRQLLRSAGAIVSGVDDDGIQMAFGLSTLAFAPELKKLLGNDMTFTIQALLVEQVGPNLRNRVAHGLLSHADNYSWSALYLWWLALRICVLPLAGFQPAIP